MKRALLILALMYSAPATAHDFYSTMCCNEKDCAPAPVGDVVESPGGYRIGSLRMTVPYQDSRIRNAPDGRFHLCTVHIVTGVNASKEGLRCLYVPPRSF